MVNDDMILIVIIFSKQFKFNYISSNFIFKSIYVSVIYVYQ